MSSYENQMSPAPSLVACSYTHQPLLLKTLLYLVERNVKKKAIIFCMDEDKAKLIIRYLERFGLFVIPLSDRDTENERDELNVVVASNLVAADDPVFEDFKRVIYVDNVDSLFKIWST